jgi:hypothetical protein
MTVKKLTTNLNTQTLSANCSRNGYRLSSRSSSRATIRKRSRFPSVRGQPPARSDEIQASVIPLPIASFLG